MLIELDSSLLHIARDLAAAWSANPTLGLQHYGMTTSTKHCKMPTFMQTAVKSLAALKVANVTQLSFKARKFDHSLGSSSPCLSSLLPFHLLFHRDG